VLVVNKLPVAGSLFFLGYEIVGKTRDSRGRKSVAAMAMVNWGPGDMDWGQLFAVFTRVATTNLRALKIWGLGLSF